AAGCAGGGRPGTPAPSGPERAAAAISARDVLARENFLAADALRGRDMPSDGLEMAASYVASEFQKLGLEPAGDAGSYIQRYPYERSHLNDDVVVGVKGAAQRPEFGRDYFVMVGSTPLASGPAYWAGTLEQAANAPANAMKGAVVLFDMPGAELNREWMQGLQAAVAKGAAAGAVAVGLVLDPALDPGMVRRVARYAAMRPSPLPAFAMLTAPARAMLAGAGADLDALRAAGKPAGVANTALEVGGTRTTETSQEPNIVGILKGSDPALAGTYVVYSAHVDHIGVGRPDAAGDSINNGADDDASGVTAVLELAEAFASLPTPPARSMMFVVVSGEEKGLLGSSYFADHTPVPDTAIVADINMDMIGRNAPDSVVAIGQEYSSLGPLTHQVADAHPELGLTVAPDLWPEQRFFFRSDHFNFARKHIPAIFFTTGLHDDYHRPSDEVSKLDTDKLARITRLAFHLGNAIGTDPVAPTWTEDGWAQVQQMIQGRGR
ncbi:MAG TPA: M28 family peptidase, partial [Longimicrobiales bacterium]|nr:M28 family peptidase [Longimicrobiales bacterium]